MKQLDIYLAYARSNSMLRLRSNAVIIIMHYYVAYKMNGLNWEKLYKIKIYLYLIFLLFVSYILNLGFFEEEKNN